MSLLHAVLYCTIKTNSFVQMETVHLTWIVILNSYPFEGQILVYDSVWNPNFKNAQLKKAHGSHTGFLEINNFNSPTGLQRTGVVCNISTPHW